MRKFAHACFAALTLVTASVAADAHELQWPTGAARTAGYGHCAKGSCMKRVSFKASVPHRHLAKGVCEGRGAGGYTFGRRFPC